MASLKPKTLVVMTMTTGAAASYWRRRRARVLDATEPVTDGPTQTTHTDTSDIRVEGGEKTKVVETTMDSSRTASEVEPGAARKRRPFQRLAAKAVSWLVMAGLGAVVVGLLALSVGPRFLPYQALVVRSGSMAPTIPTGSIVFYHQVAATKIKVGEVIAFSKPGEPSERVTHRVFKIGVGSSGRYFVTKGDANAIPDTTSLPEAAAASRRNSAAGYRSRPDYSA